MEIEPLELEYNNIKHEIFVLKQRCDSLIIAIYTVSNTLMGFGYQFKSTFFFALVAAFIIPLHALLNSRRYHMVRCSMYIKLCIEPHVKGLQWESIVDRIDKEFKAQYRKNKIYKLISCIIGIGTPIIIGGSIAFVLNIMEVKILPILTMINDIISLPIFDKIILVFMILGFGVSVYLSIKYARYDKICDKYEKIIKDEIKAKGDDTLTSEPNKTDKTPDTINQKQTKNRRKRKKGVHN